MILHDFFEAAAAFDEDALAKLIHPDVHFSEMPNAINRGGTERGREEARAAFRRGKALLAEQSYEVHDVLEAGDKIAARATWRGRLNDGPELQAEIATFTEVRDGRIFRHATYDCYQPWTP
jgi:ketosteroid isomerase-like protein